MTSVNNFLHCRILELNKDLILQELRRSVVDGQVYKVKQILSFKFADDVPSSIADELISMLREVLPSTPLLHRCATEFTPSESGTGSGGGTGSSKGSKKGAASSSADPSSVGPTGAARRQLEAVAARRLEVAKVLLAWREPAMDLSTQEEGLSALHYAAQCGDAALVGAIVHSLQSVSAATMGTAASSASTASIKASTERKASLNVNTRCHRKGWAPIHYAVDSGSISIIKTLSEAGANLAATGATDKRWTPLELARIKLKAASKAADKALAQSVLDALSGELERQKAAKKAHDSSNSGGSSSSGSSSGTAAPSEKKPSKVMKEPTKQSSTLNGSAPTAASTATSAQGSATGNKTATKATVQSAESSTTAAAAGTAAAAVTSSKTADKKKKKQEKKKSGTNDGGAPAGPGSTSVPGSGPTGTDGAGNTTTPAPTLAKQAKGKKAGKGGVSSDTAKASSASTSASAPASLDLLAEMSVASRDEMMDRLLAMGFLEADCLHAISLYGTDFDRAISWLVDRPAVDAPLSSAAGPSGGASSAGVSVASGAPHVAGSGGGSGASAAGIGPSVGAGSVRSRPGTGKVGDVAAGGAAIVASSGGSSSGGLMSLSQAIAMGDASITAGSIPGLAPANTVKLQKEKEELRRINRAWNQKAEDEKRKVSSCE